MPVVSTGVVNDVAAEVEFVTNASNVVTGINIRSALPVNMRVVINHPTSGYNFNSELVMGAAPITISVPNPRRFPNDGSAFIEISSKTRSVP